MRLTRRYIASLVLVFSFSVSYVLPPVALTTLVVSQTACPLKVSESTLDKTAKASRTIATRYVETVDFVDGLWEAKVITNLATKDKIADALITFGKNGKRFNSLLAQYSTQFKDGNVPGNVWKTISEHWAEITRNFLIVLDMLPQAAGLAQSAAFRAISAAVLAIATSLAQTGFSVPKLKELQEGVSRNGLV